MEEILYVCPNCDEESTAEAWDNATAHAINDEPYSITLNDTGCFHVCPHCDKEIDRPTIEEVEA